MNSLTELDAAFQEALTKTADVPEKMAQWQQSLQDFIEQNEPEPEELEPFLEEWRRILQINKHLLEEHQESLKEKIKIGQEDAHKLLAAGKYKH